MTLSTNKRLRVTGFLRVLAWSPLGLSGLGLAIVSGILLLLFAFAGPLGIETGPYFGIVAWILLPALFVLGLLLTPIGYLRARRRLSEGDAVQKLALPILDFNNPRLRRNLLLFVGLSFANLLILGMASYQGVHTMESNAFCGLTCHRVMEPEYTAFQFSPHASVKCVDCHVGPGATGFARAKLSGVRQLFSVVRGSYARPIPAPVENLRPARETCEACHWPAEDHGDRLRIRERYNDDEKSSRRTTVLLLHVGGAIKGGGEGHGIHWHMNLANEITYLPVDRERTKIPWVRLKDAAGRITEFSVADSGLSKEEIARAPKRTMDCIDCHNRPAHRFSLPEEAVDEAIRERGLDRNLPYLRREMISALKASYIDKSAAQRGIAESLAKFYRESYPEVSASSQAAIGKAAAAAQVIYERNVFPGMRVGWAVHPDHLGHEHAPGCFRCHDGEHKSSDGREISQDCGTCHTLLAVEEEEPPILKTLAGQ
ncbi:MAG TPA: NapC/NirT family cytochrome c [Candidatus Polarisedimenticolia bacterium]|jgi:nitrate/TMAO reductase-like tetraheme cytochrome c subunit|nr:NapC/NirT family cytochrome c [Candidatus Polarisedimenticolia bacterium]